LLGTTSSYNVKFFPISAMPCVTHLLFPPCSRFGAGRGGYRRRLAHGHRRSEEGA
jgi:hypothetical protein